LRGKRGGIILVGKEQITLRHANQTIAMEGTHRSELVALAVAAFMHGTSSDEERNVRSSDELKEHHSLIIL
jgi:hypothetical protein